MSYEFIFKYIVIGDTCVGKSCLQLQFTDEQWRAEHEITIGVEFGARTVTINNVPIKLQIWDTAGQENFKSITRSYFRSSAGAQLVYDITRRESFDNCSTWQAEARAEGNKEMSIFLIGNKSDLESERAVSYEEGANFALSNGIKFIETSAKKQINVDMAFIDCGAQIQEKVQNGLIDIDNDRFGVRKMNQNQPNNRKYLSNNNGNNKDDSCQNSC